MVEHSPSHNAHIKNSLLVISRSLGKLGNEVAILSDAHEKAISVLRVENQLLVAKLKAKNSYELDDIALIRDCSIEASLNGSSQITQAKIDNMKVTRGSAVPDRGSHGCHKVRRTGFECVDDNIILVEILQEWSYITKNKNLFKKTVQDGPTNRLYDEFSTESEHGFIRNDYAETNDFCNIPSESQLLLKDHLGDDAGSPSRLMKGVAKFAALDETEPEDPKQSLLEFDDSKQNLVMDRQVLKRKKSMTYGSSEIFTFVSDSQEKSLVNALRVSADIDPSSSRLQEMMDGSSYVKSSNDSAVRIHSSKNPRLSIRSSSLTSSDFGGSKVSSRSAQGAIIEGSEEDTDDDRYVSKAFASKASSSGRPISWSTQEGREGSLKQMVTTTTMRFMVRPKLSMSGELESFIDQGGACTTALDGNGFGRNLRGSTLHLGTPSETNTEEFAQQKCLFHCPLFPTSGFKLAWECFGVILLMYDMVVIPMQVFEMPTTIFSWAVSWLILVYWCSDLVLSFFVGYYTADGKLVMNMKDIARHYFKSWFFPDVGIISVDLISLGINIAVYGSGAFHFEAEENSQQSTLGIMRVGKALRVLRLIRLFRIMKLSQSNFMEILQEKIMSEFVFAVCNIANNMIILCFICHGCACIFYYVGTQNYENDTNWTTHYGYDTRRWMYCYLAAFHWALAQFANGEVIIEPQSIPERLVNLAVLMASMMFFSAFLGIVGNIVQQLFHRGAKRRNEQWVLRVYLRQIGISWDLKMRVKRYINVLLQSSSNQVSKADVNYINILSRPLQMELQTEQYLQHFTVHPFFSLLSKRSFYAVRELCCSAVKESCLSQHDTLFSAGEEIDIMYFVYTGSLSYTQSSRVPETAKRTKLVCDEWFCEAALWTERWLTCGTVSADTDSELVGIIGEQLLNSLSKHHTNMHFTREYANAFVKGINSLLEEGGIEAITDVTAQFDEVDGCLASYGFGITHGRSTGRHGTASMSEMKSSQPASMLSPFGQFRSALQEWTGLAGLGAEAARKRPKLSNISTESSSHDSGAFAPRL